VYLKPKFRVKVGVFRCWLLTLTAQLHPPGETVSLVTL